MSPPPWQKKFDGPPMYSSPVHWTSPQRSSRCFPHHDCHNSCLGSLAHLLSFPEVLHYSSRVLRDFLPHFPCLEPPSSRCWWNSVHPLHSCRQHCCYFFDHDFHQLSGLNGQCEIFPCASSATLQPQTPCHRLCRETPPPLWVSHSISACETSGLSQSRKLCPCNRCTGKFCLSALIATVTETCIISKYTTMFCHRCST